METYELITFMFGNDTINFRNGIVEVKNDKELEVVVEKTLLNLSSLLEAGVTFVTLGNSYRFHVLWGCLYGVER